MTKNYESLSNSLEEKTCLIDDCAIPSEDVKLGVPKSKIKYGMFLLGSCLVLTFYATSKQAPSNAAQAQLFALSKSKSSCPHQNGDSLLNVAENPNCILKKCQGDCDTDSDCKNGLSCYFRDLDSNSAPPGCNGSPKGKWDYCFEDKGAACSGQKNSNQIVNVSSRSQKQCVLQKCQGDCQTDDDCADGLMCLQRGSGTKLPPGCLSGSPKSEWDYCVPKPTPPPHDPSKKTTAVVTFSETSYGIYASTKLEVHGYGVFEGSGWALPGLGHTVATGVCDIWVSKQKLLDGKDVRFVAGGLKIGVGVIHVTAWTDGGETLNCPLASGGITIALPFTASHMVSYWKAK